MTTETEDQRIPEHFTQCPETLMSNFDHEIDEMVAHELKSNECYAHYAGWNFSGEVWWDSEAGTWRCEVWQYKSYVETVSASTLEGIMEAVSAGYGRE